MSDHQLQGPNQRIYGWGYCDACDDLHPCTDEREGVPKWVGVDPSEEHDEPAPVWVGLPSWAVGLLLDNRAQAGGDDERGTWPPPAPGDVRSRARSVLEALVPLGPYIGLVDLDYVQFPNPDGSLGGQLTWRWADPNRWDWPEANGENT